MESLQLVVDTDILVDVLRQETLALAWLSGQAEGLAISQIMQMELLMGATSKAVLRQVEKALVEFAILPVRETIGDTAVALIRQYRLSHGLAFADAMIAATALTYDLPLITKNQRDFRFITGLQLLPYPA